MKGTARRTRVSEPEAVSFLFERGGKESGRVLHNNRASSNAKGRTEQRLRAGEAEVQRREPQRND